MSHPYLALIIALAFSSRALSAECNLPPKAVVKNFYAWYLEQLDMQKHPLFDNPQQMQEYITRDLASLIKKKISSPDGLTEDYFLKSQDQLEDWPTSIEVREISSAKHENSEKVTLGITPETHHSLEVQSVLIDGCWKINKVTHSDRSNSL